MIENKPTGPAWTPFNNNDLPKTLRFSLPIDFCRCCNKPTFFGFFQPSPSLKNEISLACLDVPLDSDPIIQILCQKCFTQQNRAERKPKRHNTLKPRSDPV